MTRPGAPRPSPVAAPPTPTSETIILPNIPDLGTGIHVWALSLKAFDDVALPATLSEEERDRAARFHFEIDRRRFAVTRTCLRLLLAKYTQEDASRLEFCYAEYGKPSLSAPATDVRFNVSHSHDLALLAFTRGREIGVDVEYVRPEVEIESLAQRFFSLQEGAAIRSLSEDAKVKAFFHCWTCKEAFLKAKGFGLSVPLDSFDVSVNSDRPAALLATRPAPRDRDHWSIWTLTVAVGYAAAVVSERCDEAPRLLHWSPSREGESVHP